MSLRTHRIGGLCLAAALAAGPAEALADITSVQTRAIAETQTNWSTATPGLQGANPLVFDKFDPGLGTLNAVHLTMGYNIAMSATMTFTTASTIVLSSGYPLTPGGPLQGTTIDLNLSSDPGAPTLLEARAPVLTFTKTYDPGSGMQAFSTSEPAGSPFHLVADGGASNTLSGTATTTLTDPSQVGLFTGSGTIGLPALAFSGSSFLSDTGNGGGTVLTYAGITVGLSYEFTPSAVPEPPSFVLLATPLALAGAVAGLFASARRRKPRSTPSRPE